MLQAVIFDMDGVLIDSVGINWQAYNQALSKHGVKVEDHELSSYVGRTLKDQVSLFNHNFGLTLDLVHFGQETDAIKKKLFTKLKPKAGVVELLTSLKEKHIPIAVGSSSASIVVDDRLKSAGIYGFFNALVTEQNVTRHKPDPEVFQAAAAKLGISATRCVVIEDAPAGITAAKKAGMKCCAVRTAQVAKGDLTEADLLVSSLTEIDLERLQELFNS